MKIDPSQAGKVQSDRSSRSAESTQPAPARSKTPAQTPDSTGADRVELSSEARSVLEQMGVPSGTLAELPPQRVKQIFERVAHGFYDRQDVKDEVLRHLADRLDVDTER